MDSTQYPHPSWIRSEAIALGEAINAEIAKREKPPEPKLRRCVVCYKRQELDSFDYLKRKCKSCVDKGY